MKKICYQYFSDDDNWSFVTKYNIGKKGIIALNQALLFVVGSVNMQKGNIDERNYYSIRYTNEGKPVIKKITRDDFIVYVDNNFSLNDLNEYEKSLELLKAV